MATSISQLNIICPNCGAVNALITNHLSDNEEISCSHCKKRVGTFGELRNGGGVCRSQLTDDRATESDSESRLPKR